MIDRKTKILIFMPFIFVILMFIAGSFMRFNSAFSPAERQYLIFDRENVDIIERKHALVTKSVKSPLDIPIAAIGRDITGAALETSVSKETSPVPDEKAQKKEIKVSFILINAGGKIAIINGRVMRERDVFDGDSMVVSIEKDMVMIKEAGKEGKWVKMN
ncbi:MAG: hypothetical protein HZB80_11780 [Deltaproteobacteria bacterium]|nr:hypothetical protein [Deltaproteobacteria bacterium]